MRYIFFRACRSSRKTNDAEYLSLFDGKGYLADRVYLTLSGPKILGYLFKLDQMNSSFRHKKAGSSQLPAFGWSAF